MPAGPVPVKDAGYPKKGKPKMVKPKPAAKRKKK